PLPISAAPSPRRYSATRRRLPRRLEVATRPAQRAAKSANGAMDAIMRKSPPILTWPAREPYFELMRRTVFYPTHAGAAGAAATLRELVLTKDREITSSDAGSLYLVEQDTDGTGRLFFALAQNDSMEVPFRATPLPLSSASVAGHVALTGATMNLTDAYTPPDG